MDSGSPGSLQGMATDSAGDHRQGRNKLYHTGKDGAHMSSRHWSSSPPHRGLSCAVDAWETITSPSYSTAVSYLFLTWVPFLALRVCFSHTGTARVTGSLAPLLDREVTFPCSEDLTAASSKVCRDPRGGAA